MSSAGEAQAQGTKHPIFQALKTGQHVSLVGEPGMWRVKLLGPGQVGSHRVVDVGAQHLALDDIVGLERVWIPVTAVHSVTWLRVDPSAPAGLHRR